jgi:membrane complex biogenesis BtpA family protein
MAVLETIFGRQKALIGVVHLESLPGSPGWGRDAGAVVERALADARAIEEAGFDGLILENFGDAPFARAFAGRGAVAGLAAAGAMVAEAVDLPVGVNVLRSDGRSAVAVAAAIGGRFIRVNVHTGAAVTDQGIIQGEAMETMLSVRDMSPGLAVFADVFVKHAAPLGDISLEQSAKDAVERGLASALIVTGEATGSPAASEHLIRVKAAVPGTPVLVGSGVTAETAGAVLGEADGIIVGSAIMESGRAANPIDPGRAKTFAEAARG